MLGLMPSGTGKINLIDITGVSWSAFLAQAASTYANPSMLQAGNYMALALGNAFAPQLWNGSSLVAITNTWNGGAGLPAWSANTTFATGTAIVASGYIFTAQAGGTTNSSGAPDFAATTTYGATIPDGSGSSIVWQNAGTATPPAPPGAAFLFYHGGFLYAWGNDKNYTDNPNLYGPDGLCQSDLNDFTSWNPLNAIFVDEGDGEVPMGGAVFTLSEAGIPATAQLVLFKQTKTFALLGFLPDATLQATPSGVGCNAPGSIQFFAELGVMRLCYRGFAVFDGQNDNVEQYTDPITSYLFGGANAQALQPVDFTNIGQASSFQTDNPRMYVCFVPLAGSGGTLVRGFCYDITEQAWTVIDLPWQIAAAAYIPQNPNASLIGGANDGTIRRMFAGDQTWDGVVIQSSLRTPEIGEPVTPGFARRLVTRGQASVTGNGAKPTFATLNYMDRDGSIQQVSLPPSPYVAGNIDIGLKLLSANADLGFQGQVILEGLEWHGSKENPQPIEPTAAQGATVSVIYQSSGSAPVAASAQSVTVTLPGIGAPNATYILSVTPNWNTTFWVSQKTSTTFTIFFATPAPPDGSGSIDWGAEITQ